MNGLIRNLGNAVALLALAARVGLAQVPAGSTAPDNSLSGVVTDMAGHAIAAVEVRIPELARTTLTGADGTYRFEQLPAGHYTVTVNRFGFAPAVHTVDLNGAATLGASLVDTPFRLPVVEITATRAALAPGMSPLPTSSLFGEALRKNQSISLAHAIEGLPGVHTASTGEQVGKPVIRGLQGARVLVLDDGRRLEDYSWSDEDGPSIDARQMDRVEVVRGPASVLYGSDALGGVVNAIPADLPEAVGPGGIWRGQIESYAASNNHEFGAGLRLEGAKGRYGWRAHGIGRVSGDLRTPDGKLGNTGFGAFTGDGALGVHGAAGNAQVRVVHYGGEFKLLENEGPGTGFGGTTQEEGPERKLLDDRVQFGGNYFTHGARLEARGQWQRHSLIEVADDPTAAPGSKTESEQFNLLLQTGTLDLIAHHSAGPLHGSAGVNGLEQSNDTRGPIPLVPDAHVTSGAVFAFEQLDFERWSVLGGGRVDFRHLDADANAVLRLPDQSRDDTQGSGDVGLVFRPVGRLSIAANAGRAWRAPTLFELFANGPRLGEARYERGRADMKPEGGMAYDASARWQNQRFRTEVAGFANRINDFIFVTPTSDSIGGLRVYSYEQANATLAGTEALVEAEVRPNMTVQVRFDAVWGRNDELDEPLPLMPAPRGAVAVSRRWHGASWAEDANVGGEVVLSAEQSRLSTFDFATPAYALLHLEGSLRRRWMGRSVQLDLQVRNATNARYRDYLSRYKEFALDPGRNVLFRVSTGIR